MFQRILIANRGEIAIRIMRAAKELGIETVAIYHKVDKGALFVRYADFAVEVVAAEPKYAYLDISQIIEKALEMNCQAIHPGYGFLSERAEFSAACRDAGIKFIGPSSESIDAMGSKTNARKLMAEAGVPIVPGTKEPIKDIAQAKQIAREIGYPILLKASAGGGGKGMRNVNSESDFDEHFQSAQREALKAFGDDSVYIEKFIQNPKHIEIQVIADEFGNYAYLGERDCSIQRRHQKLIEEAPSTVMNDKTRKAMGEVAVRAARAVNYVNAGTIEFLFDKSGNFYFLEMNTRLQVEHPVTEFVTGIDIVKEQIRIASGEQLSFTQSDVHLIGHSIECRINAEDVFNDFLPSIGKITNMIEPKANSVRLDTGVAIGSEVSFYFDPLLAKLIVYGKTRNEAIEKMKLALDDLIISGIKSNIPFHQAMMKDTKFLDGSFHTNYLENEFDISKIKSLNDKDMEAIAAILAYNFFEHSKNGAITQSRNETSLWKMQELLSMKNK